MDYPLGSALGQGVPPWVCKGLAWLCCGILKCRMWLRPSSWTPSIGFQVIHRDEEIPWVALHPSGLPQFPTYIVGFARDWLGFVEGHNMQGIFLLRQESANC